MTGTPTTTNAKPGRLTIPESCRAHFLLLKRQAMQAYLGDAVTAHDRVKLRRLADAATPGPESKWDDDELRPWRLGRTYGVHVYECSQDSPNGDRPVATFHDPDDARWMLARLAESDVWRRERDAAREEARRLRVAVLYARNMLTPPQCTPSAVVGAVSMLTSVLDGDGEASS